MVLNATLLISRLGHGVSLNRPPKQLASLPASPSCCCSPPFLHACVRLLPGILTSASDPPRSHGAKGRKGGQGTAELPRSYMRAVAEVVLEGCLDCSALLQTARQEGGDGQHRRGSGGVQRPGKPACNIAKLKRSLTTPAW